MSTSGNEDCVNKTKLNIISDKSNKKSSDLAESMAERFRKLGNEHFKAGEYEKAINLYTTSLEKVKG
uniref:Uncharacterized protein n=1 Tax=Ditylenchus dipsaci TaxID=166011 RepID=A0A915EHY0_9BILA